jgi:regulator of PEP synthase PpsR (kinase-PPPase family)
MNVHGFLSGVTGSVLSTNSSRLLSSAKGFSVREFHMHLVSDATGETVISAARACVAQFDGVRPIEHFWNLVRTQRQLNLALEGIAEKPGIVIYTLVDRELRARLENTAREMQVPCVPMLDPILKGLSAYLGLESKAQPGRQHTMGEEYFSRLDAMDFAMRQDDGQSPSKLDNADVILVGVSRTSKTPTCIYLANRGIKAGNVPFVPGSPLPDILLSENAPMIIGLTEDPERLVSIRRNRLRMLNQTEATAYADMEAVRNEVNEARRFYTKMGWPVIDVTRRSIEETAAEIIKILARRNVISAEALHF